MAFALENTLKIQQEIESRTIPGFQIPVRAVFDEAASNETFFHLLSR